MAQLIALIPWDMVGLLAFEYFCGKTNLFKANSTGELIQNIVYKSINKNHKI